MYTPNPVKFQKIASILQDFFKKYVFSIKNCFLLQIRENYEIYRILGDLEGMDIQLQLSLPFNEAEQDLYDLSFVI
ncbi:hypothetical protein NEF87_001735 [Candidatus Lokiarchaeum ossiferum]|uniref:Uncharacterized protein n=1 Tax=Candidatus Lokiarchaeum ossiferum TaxID=2951803 RepID=A0ABY6HPK4_9ARCH|nr:hypothetical protein NEF87_001735 [Candidatus Lokiarchaeum sp. B-35]